VAGMAGTAFGDQYNIVSFDPRGVNNSGLGFDCFSNKTTARVAFSQLHYTGGANVSAPSFRTLYYSSSIYGDRCNAAVANGSQYGYYVTSPASANDILAFVEANARAIGKPPSQAKLWAYAGSYGSLVGQTFATLFPDRVERMVLDGLINADDYYNNMWTENIEQADAAVAKFADFCYSAGEDSCAFWGPSAANITARLDSLIAQLETHPVPSTFSFDAIGQDLPTLVTSSDLKAQIVQALYTPVQGFPQLAGGLALLEQGNASAFAGAFAGGALGSITPDAGTIIRCVDSYRTNNLTTIDAYAKYVEGNIKRSKYIGDVFSVTVNTVLCQNIKPALPDSMVFKGRVGAKTAFPLLFASNTIDPITPLIS
jgi:pimeloyl-ACP methyl ester carboxylesterase